MAAMGMNNKTSPKIVFLAKTLKSLFAYLVDKIPKNIRVDVHEEKNDAESDIENIKSNGLSKNTGWPWLLIPPRISKMD